MFHTRAAGEPAHKSENIFGTPQKVSAEQRARQNGHASCVVCLTGLSAAGKSAIATELERELVNSGRLAYVLDGDNLHHSLCSDLGFTPEHGRENIRRVGAGNSLVSRLNGKPGRQKFAIGGCHPHARNASHLIVWTDEWCLIYSPIKGRDSSELYRIRTDPMQTRNIFASNRSIAEQLFAALESWLEGLGVAAERRRKMLHNVPFQWTDKMKQRLWPFGNRCSYLTHYRNCAGRPTQQTAV